MPKIKQFLKEVKIEMKKVSWPTKKELVQSTWVVIIGIIFFAILIGLLDRIFFGILKLIIR